MNQSPPWLDNDIAKRYFRNIVQPLLHFNLLKILNLCKVILSQRDQVNYSVFQHSGQKFHKYFI